MYVLAVKIESGADLVHLLQTRANILPDRTSVLREAAALTTEGSLEQIARFDYGSEADLHLQALRLIRDGAPVGHLAWHPREVLELARWSLPEGGAETPESDTRRGHLIRLFACSALLVADASPKVQLDELTENPTLVALLDSVFVLGFPRVMHSAVAHLLFRFREGIVQPEDRPFFALGLLALLLAERPPTLRVEDWECLASWVIEEEATSRSVSGFFSGPWLLGSTSYDSRHELWRRLGRRLLRMPSVPGSELLMAGVSEW